MAAIERTAYPQFRRNPVVRELVASYTPTEEDIAWVLARARFPGHRLGLALLLVSFRRLHYFPALEDIPAGIARHVRSELKLRPQVRPEFDTRTLYRFHRDIRARLGVKAFDRPARHTLLRAVADAAAVRDNPADLINVAIEQLVHDKIELPAFVALDRLTRRVRTLVNRAFFSTINDRLTEDDKRQLDELLVAGSGPKTPLHLLKRKPGRLSLPNFKGLLDHLEYLDTLVGNADLLAGLPEIKRLHFAREARALDAAELRDFTTPKRHALVVCLIQRARVECLDAIAEMFLKRIAKMHALAREELAQRREQVREAAEAIVATMSDVVRVLDTHPEDADAGREIRRLVGERGGIPALQAECAAVSATHDDNHLPLLLPHYLKWRPKLLRMIQLLELRATSEDRALMDAIAFLRNNPRARGEWLEAPMDLAFTTHAWRSTLCERTASGETRVHRLHFEVCVFAMLAHELRSGDVAIVGSEAFADYRDQLLAWDECEPLVADYCEQAKLPATAEAFVAELQVRLTQAAEQTDQGYMANSDVAIDESGLPVLKRHRAKDMTASAKALEAAVLERMRERSVIEILCDVQHWTNWSKHFGPLSGSDPKLDEPHVRYVLTTFTYGCNLGPAQAARHLRGAASAHMLSFVNRRHIDANRLAASSRDIINSFAHLQLPRFWGQGKAAAADGTKYELFEKNLLASYHIRYGGYGGIAYHHVSDTYIALFSHFIPCGVWEAVYIFDGLIKNTSEIQPERVHADTQGQSLPVFGLSHLLGVELMPRIRNWQDYRFFRPADDLSYDYIDTLFKDTVDWDLIELHWKDLMQVALSIRAGKIAPSTLLRKLGTASRKNRLYHAFKALGTAVRTLFLLRYISEPLLREEITAATNKVESYNGFAKYLFFGGEGVIGQNDPLEQEKAIKYNDLVANAVVFSNVVEQTRIIRGLLKQGWKITAADVAVLSPYLTAHIKRFGDYVIEFDNVPAPYEANLSLEG
ncbi:MAG: Tn3 family transposase [Arenimonas sp.]|uniref:Tn3 family transposase n=1 Tax=Arenimonas sp. TaxID=1872635 RepID=UPI0025C4DD22|nr:Tn3 family transposase [Arenimonas sp.]MBW8368763.1 Tn3 family transposase [Arenimonas sp.]